MSQADWVSWNYPTAIKVGTGRVRELAQHCQAMAVKAPLIVTDPGLAALPVIGDCLQQLKDAGLRAEVFSRIKGNPTGRNVEDGVAAFKTGKHDGVVAFGGGSALDAGKAIALMVGQHRPLWDFEDVGDNWTRVNVAGMAPVIAIPTTAGTGSEVGRVSVITDETAQLKRLIFHPKVMPPLVILDPEVTVGLPAKLTAATGLDALSHSLEAYCSPFFHPAAVGIAIEGMHLIKQWLPTAVRDGRNIEARLHMLVASMMGATAFQRGLGAMHALAHPLGAVYDAHHGMLNAVLMPYVLKANERVIAERITALSRYLDLPNPSFTAFLDYVLQLREEVGIPHTLTALGIDDQQIKRIGKMATEDPSAGTNPIPFTADEYAELCRHAVVGLL